MRLVLSTNGSPGDVDPVVGLAVQLRALGTTSNLIGGVEMDQEPERSTRRAAIGIYSLIKMGLGAR